MGVGESFPDRQLRTSTDVICSPSIEWIHGGLHLQVTHHLFPRLPRHNLRAASALVKEFAKAVKSKGGLRILVNREEIKGAEWKDVFDYNGEFVSSSLNLRTSELIDS